MNDRKSGNAYAVTGPKYCDGSFRPRKLYSIFFTWMLDLALSFFPLTECEQRESKYPGASARVEKIEGISTFKDCEGLCQRNPVSKYFNQQHKLYLRDSIIQHKQSFQSTMLILFSNVRDFSLAPVTNGVI